MARLLRLHAQRSTRTAPMTAVGVGFDAQLVPEVPHGRTISRHRLVVDRPACLRLCLRHEGSVLRRYRGPRRPRCGDKEVPRLTPRARPRFWRSTARTRRRLRHHRQDLRRAARAGVDCITTGTTSGISARSFPTSRRQAAAAADQLPARHARWAPTCSRRRGQKIVVINVMCRLFMDALDDPFRAIDAELAKYGLGGMAHFILIDVHGEATRRSSRWPLLRRPGLRRARHAQPYPTADSWVLPGAPPIRLTSACAATTIGDRHEEEIAVQRLRERRCRRTPGAGRRRGTLCAAWWKPTTGPVWRSRCAPVAAGRAAAADSLDCSILYPTGPRYTY